ncbi:MAG TPA: phosphate acyltransferase PlsX [Bacteroidales bacterium]|nr:phosphate acyltransferase PlsX [Bacteroidales bacterium]
MRIGLDILGGDFAPEATVKGAILAAKILPSDSRLVLIGDQHAIQSICQREQFDSSVFDIVHTSECIQMGEHPARAFAQKPNASVVKGFKLLAHREIDGFASAGNTGAMMVGAMQIIKSIPGIIRPCIAASIPRPSEFPSLLLDVGLNPDCEQDELNQYAILGNIYSRYVVGINAPKIGLLNIGEEESKGNLVTKAAHQLMKDSTNFNFVGNVEGNDMFSDKADVLVCDGFVGNIMLKEAEAFYTMIRKRKIVDDFFEKFNFVNYGGTPVLGINAPVLIAHGISNDVAIKNLVLHTAEVIKSNLCEKIKEAFKECPE